MLFFTTASDSAADLCLSYLQSLGDKLRDDYSVTDYTCETSVYHVDNMDFVTHEIHIVLDSADADFACNLLFNSFANHLCYTIGA